MSTYLIYDHDIDIPRFQRDGIQPVYLQKPDGSFYLDSNGNKIQARYYWNYVMTLDKTEEDLKKTIQEKLVKGL